MHNNGHFWVRSTNSYQDIDVHSKDKPLGLHFRTSLGHHNLFFRTSQGQIVGYHCLNNLHPIQGVRSSTMADDDPTILEITVDRNNARPGVLEVLQAIQPDWKEDEVVVKVCMGRWFCLVR